ncbi:MAG: head GIN domain-containing protein [Acidobacteriota bacterium]|nr:head GIN domain-containing protein [Acidobacteriota bacterium]
MPRIPPMTRLILLGIALLALPSTGCVRLAAGPVVRGSGVKATRARQVDTFDRIDLRGSLNLEWSAGDQPTLEIVTDENLLDLVVTQVRSGTLLLSTRGSCSSRLGITVRVTSPALEEVKIAGSGDARLEGLTGSRFSVIIRGSGDVVASGAVDRLEVDIQGSGDAQAFALPARLVSVSIAGSGDAEVEAIEALEVSIAGSGDVIYHGDPPRIERRVHGSGDVIHRPLS